MAQALNSSEDLYLQLDDYDWANDAEFQGGLQAILGSASSPDQIQQLTLRAKCFYYSRKAGTRVDFDGYKAWSQPRQRDLGTLPSNTTPASDEAISNGTINDPNSQQSANSTSPMSGAPTPASFAEICELIASGKPIPGIKEIPDTILDGQATSASATKRKKPWEKDTTGPPTPNWQT